MAFSWLINGGDPNHWTKSWDDPPSYCCVSMDINVWSLEWWFPTIHQAIHHLRYSTCSLSHFGFKRICNRNITDFNKNVHQILGLLGRSKYTSKNIKKSIWFFPVHGEILVPSWFHEDGNLGPPNPSRFFGAWSSPLEGETTSAISEMGHRSTGAQHEMGWLGGWVMGRKTMQILRFWVNENWFSTKNSRNLGKKQQLLSFYPSSRNHGSGEWDVSKTFLYKFGPFSTSRVIGDTRSSEVKDAVDGVGVCM